MVRKERSVGNVCTPTYEVFVDVLGLQMGCSSTFFVNNLQKPTSKSCWKTTEKTKNPTENFC